MVITCDDFSEFLPNVGLPAQNGWACEIGNGRCQRTGFDRTTLQERKERWSANRNVLTIDRDPNDPDDDGLEAHFCIHDGGLVIDPTGNDPNDPGPVFLMGIPQ